jgi:hypothetical protein
MVPQIMASACPKWSIIAAITVELVRRIVRAVSGDTPRRHINLW